MAKKPLARQLENLPFQIHDVVEFSPQSVIEVDGVPYYLWDHICEALDHSVLESVAILEKQVDDLYHPFSPKIVSVYFGKAEYDYLSLDAVLALILNSEKNELKSIKMKMFERLADSKRIATIVDRKVSDLLGQPPRFSRPMEVVIDDH